MNVYEKMGFHVCRACLTLSKEVHLIFQEDKSVVSMLHALSIELNPVDKFSKHICKPCFEKLNMAYSFIEMFKNSQKLVQETNYSDENNGINKEIHESFQSEFKDMSDTIVINDVSEMGVKPVENGVGPSFSHNVKMLETKCTSKNPFIFSPDVLHQELIETPVETPEVEIEKVIGVQNFENHVFSFADGKYKINLYDCQFCNASFNDFKSFCSHLMNHNNQTIGPISCGYCDSPSKTFSDIKSFTLHLCTNHKLMFHCKYCSSPGFESFLTFCRHMKHSHKKLTMRNVFNTPSAVPQELLVYPCKNMQTINLTCPFCTKTCLCLPQFRYHLWTHFSHQIGAKPFTCGTCKEAFALKENVTKHYRTFPNCRPKQQKEKS